MGHENRYNGIGKAAWGYFFIYIDLKINSVSLLPAFVGYLLFLSAIGYLREEERELELLRPLGVVLALWHGINWLASFGGADLNGMLPVVDILIGLVNLYFHFQLLTNLASVARKHQPEGYTLDAELLRYRTVQTVLQTILIVFGYFSELLGGLGVVASLLMMIVCLIAGIGLMKVLFELRGCLAEDSVEE